MILLTGDSGFIGSVLARELFRSGSIVHGIDRSPEEKFPSKYKKTFGDILDRGALLQATKGADCVIHLAAEHKDYGVTSDEYFRVNELGTINVLECAGQSDIRKFIFFSSVAVYGDESTHREDAVPRPNNDYGRSKLAAERAVHRWVAEYPRRQAIIIRPTVVFGPSSRANIYRLISSVTEQKFVWIGSGKQVKSIAYVENLVDATLFLLTKMKPGVEIYNYSDYPQMTMKDLVSLIARCAGVPEPRVSIPFALALPAAKMLDFAGWLTKKNFSVTSHRIIKFNTATIYSSDKLRSIGFNPKFTIEEGMRKNIDWYFDQIKSGQHFSTDSSGE